VHFEFGDECSVSLWVLNGGCIGLLLRRCIFLGCWYVSPNHTLSLSRGLGVGCFPTEIIPVPQGWLLRINLEIIPKSLWRVFLSTGYTYES